MLCISTYLYLFIYLGADSSYSTHSRFLIHQMFNLDFKYFETRDKHKIEENFFFFFAPSLLTQKQSQYVRHYLIRLKRLEVEF